jgi:hypothetical protein
MIHQLLSQLGTLLAAAADAQPEVGIWDSGATLEAVLIGMGHCCNQQQNTCLHSLHALF